MSEPLDKFGAFFVQNLRDKMLSEAEMLLRGGWKAPELQELQAKLAGLTDAQKQIARGMAERIITAGMHDLLFAIQEQADAGGAVRVFVDGREIAKLSDGLHGEIFGEEGWIVRFSEYPSQVEIERSNWAREQIQMMQDRDENIG